MLIHQFDTKIYRNYNILEFGHLVNLTIRNKKIIWTFIKFIVVQIGPVVSEEEIFEEKKSLRQWMDDAHQVMTEAHMVYGQVS